MVVCLFIMRISFHFRESRTGVGQGGKRERGKETDIWDLGKCSNKSKGQSYDNDFLEMIMRTKPF